jgi:hypothetical protein
MWEKTPKFRLAVHQGQDRCRDDAPDRPLRAGEEVAAGEGEHVLG